MCGESVLAAWQMGKQCWCGAGAGCGAGVRGAWLPGVMVPMVSGVLASRIPNSLGMLGSGAD